MTDLKGHLLYVLSRPEALVGVPFLFYIVYTTVSVSLSVSFEITVPEYLGLLAYSVDRTALAAWVAYIPLRLIYNWRDDREWRRTLEACSRCPVCGARTAGVNVLCDRCQA